MNHVRRGVAGALFMLVGIGCIAFVVKWLQAYISLFVELLRRQPFDGTSQTLFLISMLICVVSILIACIGISFFRAGFRMIIRPLSFFDTPPRNS